MLNVPNSDRVSSTVPNSDQVSPAVPDSDPVSPTVPNSVQFAIDIRRERYLLEKKDNAKKVIE